MAKKDAKAGKAKGKDKGKGDGLPPDSLTLARYGSVHSTIRTVRSWAGIVAFGLTILLSLRAGVPLFDAWARALVVGIAAVVLAWAVMVPLWRQLTLAEIESARKRAMAPKPEAGGER